MLVENRFLRIYPAFCRKIEYLPYKTYTSKTRIYFSSKVVDLSRIMILIQNKYDGIYTYTCISVLKFFTNTTITHVYTDQCTLHQCTD